MILPVLVYDVDSDMTQRLPQYEYRVGYNSQRYVERFIEASPRSVCVFPRRLVYSEVYLCDVCLQQ
jgi:hypothetical protein